MAHKKVEARKPEQDPWSSLWPEMGEPEAVFRLSFGDLRPGAAGEVVLFNDSAFRDMVIEDALRVVERGTVRSHVTAEGIDVRGFGFIKFENGLVIFHAADTSIDLLED
jgi:hypothetical protein